MGWMGGKYSDIEAHLGDVGQTRLDVLEISVARGLRRGRAREQLVPAAEARAFAVRKNLQGSRIGEAPCPSDAASGARARDRARAT